MWSFRWSHKTQNPYFNPQIIQVYRCDYYKHMIHNAIVQHACLSRESMHIPPHTLIVLSNGVGAHLPGPHQVSMHGFKPINTSISQQ
jgi:hypothetical protein